MFFVTYHGAKPGKGKFNNIYAYDQNGKQLSSQVLQVKHDTDLAELRGICFHQNYLYVLNGSKQLNNILCFSGSGLSYKKEHGSFVSGKDVDSINHPFAIAFDNDNHCFVSNQDTDVVAMLEVNSPTSASAVKGAAASYLLKFDPTNTFFDGTFVACSNGNLPNIKEKTTPVPVNQGGLDVAIIKGKVQNSVRDIVLAGPGSPPSPLLLYVVDEPGNVIRIFDPVSGTPCGVSNQVIAPTHLLVNGDTLYVSAGKQIFSGALLSAPGKSATDICLQLAPVSYTLPPDVPTDKLAFSGMAVDDSGNFYLAVRTTNQIVKFAGADFSKPSLWLTCPKNSNPEFIVYAGADPS